MERVHHKESATCKKVQHEKSTKYRNKIWRKKYKSSAL